MQDMQELIRTQNYQELFSRINYFAGFGVIGLGILYFLFLSSILNPISWLYPTYFALFGVMILSAQTKFPFVEENFGFLQGYLGRGIFYVYTATLCLNFKQPHNSDVLMEMLAWIGFIVLGLLGAYYILTGYKKGEANQAYDVAKEEGGYGEITTEK